MNMQTKEKSCLTELPLFLETFRRHLQQTESDVEVVLVTDGKEVGISEREFIRITTPAPDSGSASRAIVKTISKQRKQTFLLKGSLDIMQSAIEHEAGQFMKRGSFPGMLGVVDAFFSFVSNPEIEKHCHYFVVIPFLENAVTLNTWIDEKPFPIPIVPYFKSTTTLLRSYINFLWGLGWTHNDLKEDAILVHPSNGTVNFYLIDYGNMCIHTKISDREREIGKIMTFISYGCKITSDFKEKQELWEHFEDMLERMDDLYTNTTNIDIDIF